jgi:hypothetical protein
MPAPRNRRAELSTTRAWQPGAVALPRSEVLSERSGIVRLLNTASGRALCLAGAVDADAVDAFWRRYGREPAPVDVIDVRSATWLSSPALELVHDHISAAERAGRPVVLHRPPSA